MLIQISQYWCTPWYTFVSQNLVDCRMLSNVQCIMHCIIGAMYYKWIMKCVINQQCYV